MFPKGPWEMQKTSRILIQDDEVNSILRSLNE